MFVGLFVVYYCVFDLTMFVIDLGLVVSVDVAAL